MSALGLPCGIWPDASLCRGETPVIVNEQGLAIVSLELPNVEPWWPHTHGRPVLHDVVLSNGSDDVILGRTGFRHLAVDRQTDGNGFQLVVNGTPVFLPGRGVDQCRYRPACRSACADYEPWLRLAAEERA